MRKLKAWTAAALLLVMLTACTLPLTPKETVPETEAIETTQAAPAVWSGYNGTLKGYVYRYEEDRDLQWEEDVLYVAEVFLGNVFGNGHPNLTHMEFRTFFAMDGHDIEKLVHFRVTWHKQFLQDINDLIANIDQLEDYEIVMALQKAIGKLGDLHSSCYWPPEYFYPAVFTPFYESGESHIYATVLPSDYESYLFLPLVEVNGIPIDEVLDALRPYISYENEYAFLERAATHLFTNEYLAAAGIAEYMEEETIFTLEFADGSRADIPLTPMTTDEIRNTPRTGQNATMAGFLTHRNTDVYYWWEHLDKGNIVYIRFNQMYQDYNYPHTTFIKEIREHIKTKGSGQTVVIDFRDNPGGSFDDTLQISLASILNMEQVKYGYVLIDSNSYSAAITVPACIRQLSEKAVLIGAPGGQPTNFYASVNDYTMPNSKYTFRMSDTWWVNDTDDEGDALMPDVEIRQSLIEFIYSIDTVMSMLQNGKRPQP